MFRIFMDPTRIFSLLFRFSVAGGNYWFSVATSQPLVRRELGHRRSKGVLKSRTKKVVFTACGVQESFNLLINGSFIIGCNVVRSQGERLSRKGSKSKGKV